jgi:hypothetical protein
MSEIEQLVDVQLAAYRARDLDAFLRCYAENVAIRDFAGNVVMDGIEGMRAQYGPLFADSPDLQVEIAHRMVLDQYVIDEELVTGFCLPGYPTELHAVVIYLVQDKAISSVVILS